MTTIATSLRNGVMTTGQGGHGLKVTPNDNQFATVRNKIAAVLNKNGHLSYDELEQIMALIADVL